MQRTTQISRRRLWTSTCAKLADTKLMAMYVCGTPAIVNEQTMRISVDIRLVRCAIYRAALANGITCDEAGKLAKKHGKKFLYALAERGLTSATFRNVRLYCNASTEVEKYYAQRGECVTNEANAYQPTEQEHAAVQVLRRWLANPTNRRVIRRVGRDGVGLLHRACQALRLRHPTQQQGCECLSWYMKQLSLPRVEDHPKYAHDAVKRELKRLVHATTRPMCHRPKVEDLFTEACWQVCNISCRLSASDYETLVSHLPE